MEQSGDTGYSGCVPLEGRRGITVLYICSKNSEPKKPLLFYYDRSIKDYMQRVSQVLSVNYATKPPAMMNLKGRNSKGLTYAPFWMGKWKGEEFNSERDCTIEPDDSGSKSFNKLVCKKPSNKTNTPDGTQKISSIL